MVTSFRMSGSVIDQNTVNSGEISRTGLAARQEESSLGSANKMFQPILSAQETRRRHARHQTRDPQLPSELYHERSELNDMKAVRRHLEEDGRASHKRNEGNRGSSASRSRQGARQLEESRVFETELSATVVPTLILSFSLQETALVDRGCGSRVGTPRMQFGVGV